MVAVKSIVWMSESLASVLRPYITPTPETIGSAAEFFARPTGTIAFIDRPALEAMEAAVREQGRAVDDIQPPGPVIVLAEDAVPSTIAWLSTHRWLSHVISVSLLTQPLFSEHVGHLLRTLTSGRRPRLVEWISPEVVGRRVGLTHASKRADRIERMSEYFERHNVGTRTLGLLRDIAEELLTNAFYDAPVAAGVVSQPISRTLDVALAEDMACDLVYGCRDDLAVIRVKDPFGSLTRERLVQVLARCARNDVQVDESMGGAGLGLWRIFTVATFVAVAVTAHQRTEFLVGIGKKNAGAKPFAYHLFFQERGGAVRRWKMLDASTSNPLDKSITIVTK